MIDLYNEGLSLRDIGERVGVSASTVCRKLKKGGHLRSKNEAAALRVENGTFESPTQDKKRSKVEKDQIARGRARAWKELDETTVESLRNGARERWNAMTDEKKEEIQKLAGAALQAVSVEGSKFEKHLYKHLVSAGYNAVLHKKGLVDGENYEIDLYLPDQKVVIEIDGPHHFLPIFGEEKLQKTMKFDSIKNGKLLSLGLCVIRLKFSLRYCSGYTSGKIGKMIVEKIKEIDTKFPPKGKRLIELEIDND